MAKASKTDETERTKEKFWQNLIHEHPDLIKEGIPELSDSLNCKPYYKLHPIATEINFDSGPMDNLFIDYNAVLTIVECKLYSNNDIKRSVYSQILNYAADIVKFSRTTNGLADFKDKFIKKVENNDEINVEESINKLNKIITDFLPKDKTTEEQKTNDKGSLCEEFWEQLYANCKNGYFRLIILCCAAPEPVDGIKLRHLMNIMTYPEHNLYTSDSILMDIKAVKLQEEDTKEKDYLTRIIWRKYAILPEFSKTRDNKLLSEKIAEHREAFAKFKTKNKEFYEEFLNQLRGKDLTTSFDSNGLNILLVKNSVKSRKSSLFIYVVVDEKEDQLQICRHQIRTDDGCLYDKVDSKNSSGKMSVNPEIDAVEIEPIKNKLTVKYTGKGKIGNKNTKKYNVTFTLLPRKEDIKDAIDDILKLQHKGKE